VRYLSLGEVLELHRRIIAATGGAREAVGRSRCKESIGLSAEE
jgi:hypothetical protein